MERIGIFGGTFNPPHIGHLQAAKEAARALELDRVLLVPSCQTPHKPVPDGSASAQQRLDMLRLATAGDPMLEVSDVEVCRGGVSYTYETVAALREQYPDAALTLLVGSDMFATLDKWKQAPQILKQVSVAVFYRGGKGEKATVEAQKAQLEADGYPIRLIENPVVHISSTQVRRMLAFRCADPFLPETVGEYIRAHGLYHCQADWKQLPMEQLEAVVVSLLNPNRVAHVLGCRDTAAELAQIWGVDAEDAARAGLLHDITKALDGTLQLTLCREYGTILDAFSQKYPKTLHALTGSLVAERIFGENPAVVAAIASHTTGKADMNMLEKIIYVADYMEPNRNFPGVEDLRHLAHTDMDGALRYGLEMTLEHLKNQGAEVSPASRDALAYLNEK